MSTVIDVQDILDAPDTGDANPCARFDRAALEDDGVIARIEMFSDTNAYIRGDYDELISAANKCGYGVVKIAGRGTAYGRLVLTPKSRRTFALLKLGRVRKIQRVSGANPRQANVIERACRGQWGHELMDSVARYVVALDNECISADALRHAAHVLNDRGHTGRGVQEAADTLGIPLGELSVPRANTLLVAVVNAVAELRGIEC